MKPGLQAAHEARAEAWLPAGDVVEGSGAAYEVYEIRRCGSCAQRACLVVYNGRVRWRRQVDSAATYLACLSAAAEQASLSLTGLDLRGSAYTDQVTTFISRS